MSTIMSNAPSDKYRKNWDSIFANDFNKCDHCKKNNKCKKQREEKISKNTQIITCDEFRSKHDRT